MVAIPTRRATPSSLEWFNDIYDNSIASAIFDSSTTELHIEVNLTARLRPLNIINFELIEKKEHYLISPFLSICQGSYVLPNNR